MIVGIVSVGEALQLPYEKLKDILSRSGKRKKKEKNVSPANQNARCPVTCVTGNDNASRAQENTHLQLKRSVRCIRRMQPEHVGQTTRSVRLDTIILVLQQRHSHQLPRRCCQTVTVDGLLLERDELFGQRLQACDEGACWNWFASFPREGFVELEDV